MSLVVDSSVALTWCFEDERTPATLALLERIADSGVVAPALGPLQVLNGGLAMAERRKRLNATQRQASPVSYKDCRLPWITKQQRRPAVPQRIWANDYSSPSTIPPTWNLHNASRYRWPHSIARCIPRPRASASRSSPYENVPHYAIATFALKD